MHLAAIVNPGRDHDLEYLVDVDGSRNVLEACVATGVRRVVVSSSGAAYGYHPDSPEWLRESDPVRGNDEFPYSRHKRLVEEMLAEYRVSHPELEQVVFRIGTILGPTVRNQITALWDGKRVLAIRGSDSPFVFVWVDDVAAAMARAATDGPPGIYNVAGDGKVTVREIAARLGKPVLTVPAGVLAFALRVGRMLHLTVHGPEQVGFLRYRPVLANDALKDVFGFTPARTSARRSRSTWRPTPASPAPDRRPRALQPLFSAELERGNRPPRPTIVEFWPHRLPQPRGEVHLATPVARRRRARPLSGPSHPASDRR